MSLSEIGRIESSSHLVISNMSDSVERSVLMASSMVKAMIAVDSLSNAELLVAPFVLRVQ